MQNRRISKRSLITYPTGARNNLSSLYHYEICDFQFVLGLCVLKKVLLNTSSLSTYLQGKTVDVTLATLRSCRNKESSPQCGTRNCVNVSVLKGQYHQD